MNNMASKGMRNMNGDTIEYSYTAKFLHWFCAVVILSASFSGLYVASFIWTRKPKPTY